MNFVKRFPLSCILLLVLAIGGFFALIGYGRIYQGLDYSPMKEPGIALVFRGIGQGIYPGQIFNAGSRFKDELGTMEASGSTEASKEASGDSAEDVSNMEALSKGEAADGVKGSEAEENLSGKQEEEFKEEDTGKAAEEELPRDENGAYLIPEGVCSPVFPAVEYGNTQNRYLSPEGTVYARDTEGIFAPTGEFYFLQEVDETYFDDALFIGDSRTDGLFYYGNLQEHADFFSRNSLSTYTVFKKTIVFHSHEEGDAKLMLEELLSEKQYGKIYVSLGMNELGIPDTLRYYEAYRDILTRIRELQPEALIFIQGILHVTEKTAKSSPFSTNWNIVERNQAISMLANGKDIFYLDMNGFVCDEEGNLLSDLSGDGVHFRASAYTIWKEFLLKNGIVVESEEALAEE